MPTILDAVRSFLETRGEGEKAMRTFEAALKADSKRGPLELFCCVALPELTLTARDFFELSRAISAATEEVTGSSTQDAQAGTNSHMGGSEAMTADVVDTEAVEAEVETETETEAPIQSYRAMTFSAAAAKFLANNGVRQMVEIDFSKCKGRFGALVAFNYAVKAANVFENVWPPLEKAFESEYVGHAHLELYEYLNGCWASVQADGGAGSEPCFSIVQSWGFGKTRLLRELAVHFHQDEAVNRVGRHRLVYVNLREGPGLQDFPLRTQLLADYFFPANDSSEATLELELADRLVHLFQFAMKPDRAESSIHNLLMELFSGKDWRLAHVLKEWTPTRLGSKRGPSRSRPPAKERRLLVFAVDEASTLLPKPNAVGVGWLRILSRALKTANAKIKSLSTYSADSGIFGISVDSNVKIVPSESSASLMATKASSRQRVRREPKPFPPFVLTHTMDALHATTTLEDGMVVADTDATKTPLARYKEEVTEALRVLPHRRASWRSLRKLGRPVWLKRESQIQDHRHSLVQFAAEKLLCGKSPDLEVSFNDQTLNGVAAVLCRVGIRPNSSNAMASRLVADSMAVLSYVSHTHEQFLSSYSSDPILTLGATRVWHGRGFQMLAKRMLPQLRELLHQEALDVGESDVMVARIVLLLAMDACARLEGDAKATHDSGAGEFFSVLTLLTALQGSDPTLRVVGATGDTTSTMTEADETATREALETVASQWKDWYVSFTHFVQLENALSEACLWALLGRRAAAIMPRGQTAVDLVIPICTRDPKGTLVGDEDEDEDVRVSMILVHVEKDGRVDASFPTCATVNMRPSEVFGRKKMPCGVEEREDDERAKFAALGPDSVCAST